MFSVQYNPPTVAEAVGLYPSREYQQPGNSCGDEFPVDFDVTDGGDNVTADE